VGKTTGQKTSDRELVAAMALGDADALRALSSRYARMLAALAYRFVNDESDAEEIAADALWQAWREAALFDATRSSVSAWLVMLGRSLKKAVGELGPNERQLLELAYFSDMSQAEIAQKVGVPLGTVKTRMRTALIKLRDGLKRLQ
jgi:RNA polymerase sigma-70 factor (ECF subfamily)